MENGQLWTMQTDSTTKKYKIIKHTLGFNSHFNELDSTNINLATGQTEKESWQILEARQGVVLLKNKKKPEMMLITNTKKHRIPARRIRRRTFCRSSKDRASRLKNFDVRLFSLPRPSALCGDIGRKKEPLRSSGGRSYRASCRAWN